MTLTIKFVVILVCFVSGEVRAQFTLKLPDFGLFNVFGNHPREERRTGLKEYSGLRVRNDSLRMVYFHDQTVAVVELGPKKLLLNCELIEVYEPEQALVALGELQRIARPVAVSFPEMLGLMDKCRLLDSRNMMSLQTKKPEKSEKKDGRNVTQRSTFNNPLSLLSGIIPGTKWCGTGDIARSYHDLGTEAKVDLCCRAHDLCPVKVRAYSRRYNLTNGSLYTKSHCFCDDDLYKCLKKIESPTAHIMGNVYFNLVQVPCVVEGKSGKRTFRKPHNF